MLKKYQFRVKFSQYQYAYKACIYISNFYIVIFELNDYEVKMHCTINID